MDRNRQAIRRVLEKGDNFLVAAHYNPDGDALGSTAALGHMLARLGKNFAIYNVSGMPEPYAWLNLPAPLLTELPAEEPDWYLTLDCGDVDRLGDELRQRFNFERLINIDHHLGNPGFGSLNWVDPNYSSVGEMVAHLAMDMGMPMSGDLGEAIYLAIVTDTGYFSFGNTHPRTLELSAEILRAGLDPESFNAKIQNQWSLGRLKLWAAVWSDAELYMDGRVGVVRIPQQLLEATGTTSYDTDGLVNFVRRIKGVDVAVSLRENGPGQTKFSLRSPGTVNVQAIASILGGGGHKSASGGSVDAPMDEARDVLLRTIAQYLEDEGDDA